jgi:hypothetical protein
MIPVKSSGVDIQMDMMSNNTRKEYTRTDHQASSGLLATVGIHLVQVVYHSSRMARSTCIVCYALSAIRRKIPLSSLELGKVGNKIFNDVHYNYISESAEAT